MRSMILSQWRQRMMGVIWQDLGAFTTVRARVHNIIKEDQLSSYLLSMELKHVHGLGVSWSQKWKKHSKQAESNRSAYFSVCLQWQNTKWLRGSGAFNAHSVVALNKVKGSLPNTVHRFSILSSCFNKISVWFIKQRYFRSKCTLTRISM